jgi:endonuclease III
MDTPTIIKVIKILRKEVKNWKVPIITLIAQTQKDPFKVFIGTVLSLRTKDEVTANACKKLFAVADTPKTMVKLTPKHIEDLIYPTGFYKTKAKNIVKICQKLIDEYDSIVPDEIDQLVEFPNVGRKTANLVLSEGYGKPAMCVDVHVNRISNRLGYIKTKSPFESEMALREKLPIKYWIEYNFLLVAHGQHICAPVSPWCSRCPVKKYCDRVGITKSR